ncbi:MAG: DUF1343 domain-containing protein, partial [Acidobacteriota bacterium]|nr:DUF1343 domain-containing protein [Acidobacteriota bacterium]
AQFRPVIAGIEIATALRRLHLNEWKLDNYPRLLADADTFERLKRGETTEEIARAWTGDLEAFRRARAAALLYE